MFGDYFTQTLLSSTRQTAMFGNLIVSSIESSLVNTGASLVIVLVVLLTLPMLYYLRSTNAAQGAGGTMSAAAPASQGHLRRARLTSWP